jgi:hypothetical protein
MMPVDPLIGIGGRGDSLGARQPHARSVAGPEYVWAAITTSCDPEPFNSSRSTWTRRPTFERGMHLARFNLNLNCLDE